MQKAKRPLTLSESCALIVGTMYTKFPYNVSETKMLQYDELSIYFEIKCDKSS